MKTKNQHIRFYLDPRTNLSMEIVLTFPNRILGILTN